jgi:3-oxoacyl-[acyl-carrier protein] reductase
MAVSIDLSGQVAVITGGTRGIGRAAALELARAGADVVVTKHRTPPDELLSELRGLGVRAEAFPCDVSDTAACEALIDSVVKTFGRVDILVNNAGITRDGLIMRMSESDWDAVLDTNLKSVFVTCKAVSRVMMKQRSGSIINIGSVSGLVGLAGQANYAASKAGLVGFTKVLAREFASRGVRANVIAPGFIESDMTAVLDQKVKDGALAQIPLSCFGVPTDIANAILYLASPLSRYVTGQVLVVDGGMAM